MHLSDAFVLPRKWETSLQGSVGQHSQKRGAAQWIAVEDPEEGKGHWKRKKHSCTGFS